MIVLFQTNLKGHRTDFISFVLQWSESQNSKFAIWVKDATPDEISVAFPISGNTAAHQNGVFSKEGLRALNRVQAVTEIVFLDGDNELGTVLRNLSFFRGIKVRSLLLRLNFPSFLSNPRQLGIWLVKVALILALSVLANVDFRRLTFMKRNPSKLIRQVRDPLPRLPPAFADSIKHERRGYVVGMIGTIDPRKNINLAVQAIAELGDEYSLNLIGEVTPSFKSQLHQLVDNNPRVFLSDEILPEARMSTEISKLDCFLVLLSSSSPSSTLLRALSLGVPSVVGGSRVLRSAHSLFPGSVVLTKLRKKNVANAIRKAVTLDRQAHTNLPSADSFAEDLMR